MEFEDKSDVYVYFCESCSVLFEMKKTKKPKLCKTCIGLNLKSKVRIMK